MGFIYIHVYIHVYIQTYLTLCPQNECINVVTAPGILLAIATYDGKDNCISVGFITGIRVGEIVGLFVK